MDIVVRDNKKLRATNKELRAINKRLCEELETAKEVARERQVEMEEALSRWRVEQTDLEETQAELEQVQAELTRVQKELAQVRDKVRTEEHANARELFKRVMGEKRQVQKKHDDLLLKCKKAKMFYKRFERNVTDPFWADP